jgi:hypothetical protein
VDSNDGNLWKKGHERRNGPTLNKNETLDLVELPTGRNPIGKKWLFKKKMNA